MSVVTSSESLHNLMLEIYDEPGLRRFIHFATDGRLSGQLPGAGVSLEALVFATVRLLEQHGILDGALFARLRDDRPGRSAQIDRVARRFQAPPRGAGDEPTETAPARSSTLDLTGESIKGTPDDGALAVYYAMLREELHNNLVLELFEKTDYEAICIRPRFASGQAQGEKRVEYDTDYLLGRKQIIVVGDPGSGKTTALRLLALDLLRRAPRGPVPLYLPLAAYCDGIGAASFRGHIERELESLGAVSLTELERGGHSIVLLLDGWDEVQHERLRRNIRHFILEVKYAYIMTTRPEAFRSAPSSERFDILGLSPSDIREFASRRVSDARLVEGFVDWVIADVGLARLAMNPLNLSIMLIVFSANVDSRKLTRTEFYSHAFDAILRQHHRTLGGSGEVDASALTLKEIEAILVHVAYETVRSCTGRFFTHAQLEAAASSVLGRTHNGLADILSGRLGIIRNRRASGFEFFHLWYQEFLAARHLIARRTNFVKFFQEPRNGSLLPFVVGLLNRSGTGAKTLLRVPIHDIQNFCRAAGEVTTDAQSLTLLIQKILDHGAAARPALPVRIEVAPALAQMGESAIDAFTRNACDDACFDYHRRACLEAVQLLAGPKICDALLMKLADTSSQGLLWHVVEHLGNRKIAAAEAILREYRGRVDDAILQADATWALGRVSGIEPPLTEEQICNLLDLLRDGDSHVRGHTLRSIGRLRLRRALLSLDSYLAQTEHPYRWIVAESITAIGGSAAAELLDRALADEDPKVVAAAADGVSHIRAPLPIQVAARLSSLQIREEWIASRSKPLGRIAWESAQRLCTSADGLPTVMMCRHSATSYNLESRLQGRLDPPLSDAGREQAETEARRFAASCVKPERVLCSPLRRSAETAELYAAVLNVPVFVDERLIELDHGDWEGESIAELTRRGAYAAWLRSPEWTPIPGGSESVFDASRRVRDSLISCFLSGQRTLVIGHKHSLALGLVACFRAPLEEFGMFVVEDVGVRFIAESLFARA